MTQALFSVLWVIFILLNISYHQHLIEKEDKWPNHFTWTLIRGGVLTALAFLAGDRVQQLIVGGIFIFPFSFNYGLNIARGKPLMYLSDHGIDGAMMKVIPSFFAWFFFSTLLFVFGWYVIIAGPQIW